MGARTTKPRDDGCAQARHFGTSAVWSGDSLRTATALCRNQRNRCRLQPSARSALCLVPPTIHPRARYTPAHAYDERGSQSPTCRNHAVVEEDGNQAEAHATTTPAPATTPPTAPSLAVAAMAPSNQSRRASAPPRACLGAQTAEEQPVDTRPTTRHHGAIAQALGGARTIRKPPSPSGTRQPPRAAQPRFPTRRIAGHSLHAIPRWQQLPLAPLAASSNTCTQSFHHAHLTTRRRAKLDTLRPKCLPEASRACKRRRPGMARQLLMGTDQSDATEAARAVRRRRPDEPRGPDAPQGLGQAVRHVHRHVPRVRTRAPYSRGGRQAARMCRSTIRSIHCCY
jgi:hypothetical protein